jgi:hypothetical protein
VTDRRGSLGSGRQYALHRFPFWTQKGPSLAPAASLGVVIESRYPGAKRLWQPGLTMCRIFGGAWVAQAPRNVRALPKRSGCASHRGMWIRSLRRSHEIITKPHYIWGTPPSQDTTGSGESVPSPSAFPDAGRAGSQHRTCPCSSPMRSTCPRPAWARRLVLRQHAPCGLWQQIRAQGASSQGSPAARGHRLVSASPSRRRRRAQSNPGPGSVLRPGATCSCPTTASMS